MEAGAPLEGKRFCHDGRNHILPVCCLHLGGEVALPCHRVRATAQRQAARAPSPPSPPSRVLRRRGLLLWPTLHFPFCFLGFPAGRPCVILTSRKRLAVLLSFSQAQPLSAETPPPPRPPAVREKRNHRHEPPRAVLIFSAGNPCGGFPSLLAKAWCAPQCRLRPDDDELIKPRLRASS